MRKVFGMRKNLRMCVQIHFPHTLPSTYTTASPICLPFFSCSRKITSIGKKCQKCPEYDSLCFFKCFRWFVNFPHSCAASYSRHFYLRKNWNKKNGWTGKNRFFFCGMRFFLVCDFLWYAIFLGICFFLMRSCSGMRFLHGMRFCSSMRSLQDWGVRTWPDPKAENFGTTLSPLIAVEAS